MSIQINNGYKIKRVSSLKKLKKELDSIGEEINKLYYEEYHKEISILISFILDMKATGYTKELIREKILENYNFKIKEDISLNELVLLMTKREFSNKQKTNFHFDFACNLSLYILNDYVLIRLSTNKPKLLDGIGYEDTDWVKHSGNLKNLLPWGYDSEDEEPTTISSKEWKERGNDWKYALENIKPLKIRLNDIILNYNKELVLNIINNNFGKRCENIAEDVINLKQEKYENLHRYEEIRKTYTELYTSLKHIHTIDELENIII